MKKLVILITIPSFDSASFTQNTLRHEADSLVSLLKGSGSNIKQLWL
ncbi:MAG: hypothetical protein ABI285_03910 [Ginsengibacter sp.]